MFKVKSKYKTLAVEDKKDGLYIDEQLFDWDIVQISENRYHAIYQNRTYWLELVETEGQVHTVKVNGKLVALEVKTRLSQLCEKLGISSAQSQRTDVLKAPMPGLVLKVLVNEGQEVQKGDALIVLEAMKMENVLKSPVGGKVAEIKVKEGENVEKNAALLRFE